MTSCGVEGLSCACCSADRSSIQRTARRRHRTGKELKLDETNGEQSEGKVSIDERFSIVEIEFQEQAGRRLVSLVRVKIRSTELRHKNQKIITITCQIDALLYLFLSIYLRPIVASL